MYICPCSYAYTCIHPHEYTYNHTPVYIFTCTHTYTCIQITYTFFFEEKSNSKADVCSGRLSRTLQQTSVKSQPFLDADTTQSDNEKSTPWSNNLSLSVPYGPLLSLFFFYFYLLVVDDNLNF